MYVFSLFIMLKTNGQKENTILPVRYFYLFFHLRFCFRFSCFFFLKELAELVKRDYCFFESKF